MSRQINVNDPSSWDDDDRDYLRDRVEIVPVEHRGELALTELPTPVMSTADLAGEQAANAALSEFIKKWYPEEPGSPVEVAMRKLTELDNLVEDEEAGDDYDQWTAAELKAEIAERQGKGRMSGFSGRTKADAISALRADDANTVEGGDDTPPED